MPLFVKPLRSDSSLGIGGKSLVHDAVALMERVAAIHKELNDSALAEEYIEGREFYVGVLGNSQAKALPPIEVDFTGFPEGVPKVMDSKAKWDERSKEYKGTKSVLANLPDELRARLQKVAVDAYRALRVRDYGRVDLRLTDTGEIYVLEVNASCYLERPASSPWRPARWASTIPASSSASSTWLSSATASSSHGLPSNHDVLDGVASFLPAARPDLAVCRCRCVCRGDRPASPRARRVHLPRHHAVGVRRVSVETRGRARVHGARVRRPSRLRSHGAQLHRRPLRLRRTVFGSFISYAFSQMLGFPLLTGGSVRYRLWSSWGLSSTEIAKAVSFVAFSFGLGMVALSGVVFLAAPASTAEVLGLPIVCAASGRGSGAAAGRGVCLLDVHPARTDPDRPVEAPHAQARDRGGATPRGGARLDTRGRGALGAVAAGSRTQLPHLPRRLSHRAVRRPREPCPRWSRCGRDHHGAAAQAVHHRLGPARAR